uniref:coiled-coil domain-containing protein 186-like n=1 Tax=Styela clava TaxID=7725 RepID=UPI00193ACF89|nr:coiled-coil domain-containing protein 186-like [Styela clava]
MNDRLDKMENVQIKNIAELRTEEFDDSSGDEIMTNQIVDEKLLKLNDKSSMEEIDEVLKDYSSFDENCVQNGATHDSEVICKTIDETGNGNPSFDEINLNESDIMINKENDTQNNSENAQKLVQKEAIASYSPLNSNILSENNDEDIKPNQDISNLTTEAESPFEPDSQLKNHENGSPEQSDKNDASSETSSVKTDTDSVESTNEISILTLPNEESFDLNDPKMHTKIIKSCRKYFKSINDLKESVTKRDNEISNRDSRISKMNSHIKDLQEKDASLNTKFQGLLQQLEKSREQLKSHDTAARNAIERLRRESDEQIKGLKAKCLAMQKEKESAVMNYARREKELLDAKRIAEATDKRAKEAVREKEKTIVQMKGMKMDLVKMKGAMERLDSGNSQIKKETEKWKEEANSHVIKVKWAQNKLKSETDQHNETKEKLAKALIEIKRAKEEAEQIRKNCQGMIKTYQESEEMKSNSLDSKLKEKEMLLSQQEAKSGELEGIHKQQMDELRKLKQQHKDVMEKNIVMQTRVDCLEKERLKNEETLKSYEELLNRQKKEALLMGQQLKDLQSVSTQLEEKEKEISDMKETLEREQENKESMKSNEENWKTKEEELLEFTSRVSSKNAELASESENLSSKLKTTSDELIESKNLLSSLENELKNVKAKLEVQNQNANVMTSDLTRKLEDKEATVNHLTVQLDEFKDEIRTLKRKHNSSIKDLTRQLHHARKKLEPYESGSFAGGSGPTTEDGSMGSRASSDTSLDCVGKSNTVNNTSHNSAIESASFSSHSANGTDVPETMVATSGEISTQTLIERIVRLQRIHARKNEKIDFLHDHVQQLVDELQKKNKIIQHYILREESGMLMPQTDMRHATAHPDRGGKISHHLSVEINKKMQSVLEDTLMKNIALKQSIDALGSEIARLSNSGKT